MEVILMERHKFEFEIKQVIAGGKHSLDQGTEPEKMLDDLEDLLLRVVKGGALT